MLFGAEAGLSWNDLIAGTVLSRHGNELCGRSVLVATTSQLHAAATLVELDGVARRIILYPPDLSLDHLPFVADCAAADVIVSDRLSSALDTIACVSPSRWTRSTSNPDRGVQHETEWVLLTSGTTGRPKLVVHTLASLTGAIEAGRRKQGRLEYVLRHPPLWWPADISSRRAYWDIAGAIERAGVYG